MGFSILTALIFLGLLIYHMTTYSGSFTELTDGFYPTFTLFSSFSTKYATAYSGTIEIFIVFAILCTLSRWIRFFREKTQHDMFNDKSVKYSKRMFNWWDWTMRSEVECRNLNGTNCTELKLMLYEEKVRSMVAKRTISEKFSLLVRRYRILRKWR